METNITTNDIEILKQKRQERYRQLFEKNNVLKKIIYTLNFEDNKTFDKINKWLKNVWSRQELFEEFISEFQDDANWYIISRYHRLSEDFIRDFQDKVYWNKISKYQKLSEDFLREFQDKVNWHKISEYQILSENFIREFQNKVNWHKIRKFQELSEDFKLEFQDKLTNNYSQITQSE
jgi:hypothetical protein